MNKIGAGFSEMTLSFLLLKFPDLFFTNASFSVCCYSL